MYVCIAQEETASGARSCNTKTYCCYMYNSTVAREMLTLSCVCLHSPPLPPLVVKLLRVGDHSVERRRGHRRWNEHLPLWRQVGGHTRTALLVSMVEAWRGESAQSGS